MGNIDIPRIAMQMAVLLFSLSLHEFAHAWAADKLGDPTAKMLGRLTINPMAHADPVGTFLLPLLAMTTGIKWLFGWAKPVPVTHENFRHPRRDSMLVSLAGPAANIILFLIALGGLAAVRLSGAITTGSGGVVEEFLTIFFILNFVLAVFNLVPITPLDGHWIIKAVLPPKWSYAYSRLDRYGFVILLGLLYFGFFRVILNVTLTLLALLLNLVGLGFILG
jgi:Zn-dependent protease